MVAEIEPMWIESAARHLSKHEFLEPDHAPDGQSLQYEAVRLHTDR